MGIRKFRPTTPGVRQMSISTFEEITKTWPEKSLLTNIKRHAGRNSRGKITIRHRGSGAKRMYRMVDFNQTDKLGIEGKVAAIEYDPNRTAYIMLVIYRDGEKRYHIAPEGIKVGASIMTKEKAKIKTGNRITLKNIPVGYSIHNVELCEKKGGKLARTAGTSLKLVSLEGPYAQLQMPSGEIRMVSKGCFASIGIVSNAEHNNIVIGKAGRSRHMGRRPEVRGKAMNPKDHPHGGGEGRTSIGLKHPKTPWGMPALGFKTRKRKYTNKWIVRSRHLAK
ncbi:50S ribosomal protein L2 [Candidatus Peregrinibacteria bacterium RIFCSPLOWO2_01_FULL_39_12]|nr:MAG: 50S ribosomal protein L2 [Candidatus Peregrinibacteria bacterium RIFCSPLOWO2_01_FULL_39_12]OGJ43399.1 MAG: 50S ribosomal protein L2 [Candidatus Peregrinibacteria bacterium RIFCSPLOWO2_02_FULL_39_10]